MRAQTIMEFHRTATAPCQNRAPYISVAAVALALVRVRQSRDRDSDRPRPLWSCARERHAQARPIMGEFIKNADNAAVETSLDYFNLYPRKTEKIILEDLELEKTAIINHLPRSHF